MNRKKFSVASIVCAVLIAAVLVLAVACTAPTTPAPTTPAPTTPEAKTITVGHISALSGPGSDLEALSLQSIPPIADWINEQGGLTINGEKYVIDIIIEDGKGTVEGYVAAATKLVERDKIKFMIGGNRPDIIFALQSVTEPAKVLLSMGFGGGVPGLIGPDKPPAPHRYLGVPLLNFPLSLQEARPIDLNISILLKGIHLLAGPKWGYAQEIQRCLFQ